jgi:hypothetical protein
MVGFIAFLSCVVLVILASIVQTITHLPVVLILVLVTASWAAWDSTRIQLRDYKSGIALNPVGLWIGIALLWIVGFPWYLTVRYRIKAGTQERKVAAALPVAPA